MNHEHIFRVVRCERYYDAWNGDKWTWIYKACCEPHCTETRRECKTGYWYEKDFEGCNCAHSQSPS